MIHKFTPLLLILLAALAVSSSLHAQIVPPAPVPDDLVGTYEVTRPDGTAPLPGALAGVTITDNGDGTLKGVVWIDRHDGNGRVETAAEEMEITPGCHDYQFTNTRGTTGTITPNGPPGEYDSSTSTGNDRVWTEL